MRRMGVWSFGRQGLWAGPRTTAAELSFFAVESSAAELSFFAVEGCVPRKGFPMLDGVVLVVGMDFRPMPRLTP